MASKHYVEVSDAVWQELVRIQKAFKVDKHALVDDIIAEAGDLEAIAERHVDEPKPEAKTNHAQPELPLEDLIGNHSTRAAVLEPTPAEELEDLI